MDKLASRVASRWLEASEIPQVIEQIKMEPRTVWICPHCQQEMHEKALYNDGTNYFHSAPMCRDKPIALPPPKPEELEWLRRWKEGLP
jgi:hypothetical protein